MLREQWAAVFAWTGMGSVPGGMWGRSGGRACTGAGVHRAQGRVPSWWARGKLRARSRCWRSGSRSPGNGLSAWPWRLCPANPLLVAAPGAICLLLGDSTGVQIHGELALRQLGETPGRRRGSSGAAGATRARPPSAPQHPAARELLPVCLRPGACPGCPLWCEGLGSGFTGHSDNIWLWGSRAVTS